MKKCIIILLFVLTQLVLTACGGNRGHEYEPDDNNYNIAYSYNENYTTPENLPAEASPQPTVQPTQTPEAAEQALRQQQLEYLQAARADLPERSITVLTQTRYSLVLQQAADALNEAWAWQDKPYNFRLNLRTYNWDRREAAQTRLEALMMAGDGPDIFILGQIPIFTWAEKGLLADIWPLIDADPTVSRDDFYVNILEAFENDGGLWAFPAYFGFEYAGISTNLPAHMIESFRARETISVSELMQIHVDLVNNYPDQFGHMSLSAGARLGMASETLVHQMDSFIDFENRVSNLTDESFVAFLDLLSRSLTIPHSRYAGVGVAGTFELMNRGFSRGFAQDYTFRILDSHLCPANAFLPLEEDNFFTHFIPVTDDFGRLRIRYTNPYMVSGTTALLSFSEAGDSALSWEFTRHLLDAIVNPSGAARFHPYWDDSLLNIGAHTISTPIIRSYFEHTADRAIRQVLTIVDRELQNPQSMHGYAMTNPFLDIVFSPEGRERAVENTISQLSVLNEMSVTHPPFFSEGLVYDLTAGLEQLMEGTISPQAAAQQMQDLVAAWLIE